MFEPARQSKTTDIIIEKIRTAILEGRLKPGDRLPPEKQLGEQFEVSKQTLRESLRALEHLGLITLRKGTGGGAFIVAVEEQVVSRNLANYLYFKNLSIDNLSEMRRLMEPHAARCAAERMSRGELKELLEINQSTRTCLNERNWQAATACEIAFHRLIARQTDNPILILMLDFIETLLEDFKRILQPDAGFMEAVLAAHKNIYQAISSGDGAAAAAGMLEHVIQVDRHLAQLKDNKNGSRLWHNCLQAA